MKKPIVLSVLLGGCILLSNTEATAQFNKKLTSLKMGKKAKEEEMLFLSLTTKPMT